jgi:hypothetical protein
VCAAAASHHIELLPSRRPLDSLSDTHAYKKYVVGGWLR